MKRFLYVATIVGVALVATSCGFEESEPANALAEDFGRTYTASAKAYGTEQVMTEDHRIWNCGIEVIPNATYEVEFCDRNTEDTFDDLISEVIMVSEPHESAISETAADVTCGFYTTTASKYDEHGIITPDGNIWDCNADLASDAAYLVRFCDCGTEDIEDDVILEINEIPVETTTATTEIFMDPEEVETTIAESETTTTVSETTTESATIETSTEATTESATTDMTAETTTEVSTAEVIDLRNAYYISPDAQRVFEANGRAWDLGDWWDIEDAYIMSILEDGCNDFVIADSSLLTDEVIENRTEIFGETVLIERFICMIDGSKDNFGIVLNNGCDKPRWVYYGDTKLPEDVSPLLVVTYAMYNQDNNDPEDVIFYDDVVLYDTVEEITGDVE